MPFIWCLRHPSGHLHTKWCRSLYYRSVSHGRYSEISLQNALLLETLSYRRHLKMISLVFLWSPCKQHCIQETRLIRTTFLMSLEQITQCLQEAQPRHTHTKCGQHCVTNRYALQFIPLAWFCSFPQLNVIPCVVATTHCTELAVIMLL